MTNRFVEIVSTSNWNDHFLLRISLPKKGEDSIPLLTSSPQLLFQPENGKAWDVLLAIHGEWFPLELKPSNVDGAVGAWLTVKGRERADRIAAHFLVEPYLRRHSGHRIAAKFESPPGTVSVGEVVKVRMALRNVGKNIVHFHRGRHRETFRRYSFIATKFGETLVGKERLGFGGIEIITQLDPGRTFVDEVELNDWFEFKQPGKYSARCFYDLFLVDPVKPHRGIWADVASGRITFEIVRP